MVHYAYTMLAQLRWDFTVSFGNVVTLLACALYAIRLDRLLTRFLVEHEMLMSWYCKEHGIDPKDLPTRVGRV